MAVYGHFDPNLYQRVTYMRYGQAIGVIMAQRDRGKWHDQIDHVYCPGIDVCLHLG